MYVEFDSVEINRKEIIQRLSNVRTKNSPSDHLMIKIETWLDHCQQILYPQGIYDIFERYQLPDKPFFAGALKIGMGICTIGSELSELTDQLTKNGKMADGVIVDAIGSVAADTVADMLNELIDKKARELNLVPSMRYSPGYCDMSVEDQQMIFDLLHDERLPVKLSKSFMMYPIKSVSFTVNLGLEFINRCIDCHKKNNCPHRR